jgi:hypothetical protein
MTEELDANGRLTRNLKRLEECAEEKARVAYAHTPTK